MKPEAVKIVSISESDGTFQLHENELKQILCNPEVKDKRICVLSVAGVFRGGKSFLLDFFLRYLQRGGTNDWIGTADEKLEGFSWRGGSGRETTGIWIWNELLSLPGCEEVVVMLMDTQGLFDNETTMKGSATVFALSTMTSSIQVYNLNKKILETDLDHLHLFTEYGRLVEENNSTLKPLQSLVFLIRDWPYKDDHAFGEEGGMGYLNNVLSTRNNNELQQVRDHILDCFEDVRCFLMPHPGLKVEEDGLFKGQLKDIRLSFKNNLQDLVSMVLPLENVVSKKNNGTDVTCEKLFDLFKKYVRLFREGKLPKPRALFVVTVELFTREAYDKCRMYFLEQMEGIAGADKPYVKEVELYRAYQQIREQTFQKFTDEPKMTVGDVSKKFEDQLSDEMDKECEKYFKNNKNKNHWSKLCVSLIATVVLSANFGPVIAVGAAVLGLTVFSYRFIVGKVYHHFQGNQGNVQTPGSISVASSDRSWQPRQRTNVRAQ